jgi:hypothetical protein
MYLNISALETELSMHPYLSVKNYKVGSYIFELKLKDGRRTKYSTMVVVKVER